jgi:serine protease DegQ
MFRRDLASSTLVAFALATLAVGSAFAQLPSAGAGGRPSLAPMLKRVTPAVANISVVSQRPAVANPLLEDPFFRRFFDLPEGGVPRPVPQQSAGSGVIIDAEKGYVLTNNHVIENAEQIVVTLTDKRRLNAKLIGTDQETDIALLQIEAQGLTAVEIGDSDSLEVGDFVVAIGNPFALGQTVTSGIVSALGRTGLGIEGYEDFIQTDASINPGNSGGALVDLDGRLVGINTAIVSPGGGQGNIGIGFAVPIEMAKQVAAQLLEFGQVRRGRLGIGIQDVTPDLAQALQLDSQAGAIVTQVEPNSPASRAGIRAGDVIVELDGVPLEGSADLRNKVGLARAGGEVSVAFLRDGRRQVVKVTVEAAEASAAAGQPAPGGAEGGTIEKLRGAQFANLDSTNPLYGKVSGVLVTQIEPGSPAAFNGLQEGDIVTAVNRQGVASVQELSRAVRAAGSPFALNILRGDARLFIVIQ